jgi:hypothetical protein
LWPWAVGAQTHVQVDLSVSVSMTPPTFVPGGHGTFTVTVHNAGPDTAGSASPGLGGVAVFGSFFDVTTSPPPFYLVDFTDGDCWIDIFETEPLPDGSIALSYDYYFGAIPPGESRSCTSGIVFGPSTNSSFSTHWQLAGSPNYDDVNPANDRVDYVFRVRPTTIPALSSLPLVMLIFSLLLSAGWTLWRNGQPRSR